MHVACMLFTRDNGQKKISSFFSAVAAPEREGNTVRDKDSCHEKVGNKSEYFMTKGVSLCNTEHSSDNDDKFKKEKKNRSHVTPKKSNSGLGKMKTVSSPEDSSMFPESSVDSDLEIIECTPGAEKCNKPCSFSFKNNIHSPEVVPSTPLPYKTQTMSVTLLGLDSNLKNQNKLASTSINIKKSSKVLNSPIKPGSMQVKNKIVLCKLSRRNKEKSNTHNCTNQNENHENLECKDDLINKEPTSVKRAAVSGVGISPDPKRTVGPEGEVMDDEVIRCKTDLTGKFDSCIPSVCNAVKSENLSIQQTNEIDRENDESFSLLQPSMKLQQNKTLVSMVRDKETQKGHFKFVDNVLVEEKNLDFPVFPNLGKGSLEIKERISCKSSKYIDNSTVLLENENEVKNLMERNLKNVCGSLESHDSLFGGSFVSSQGFVHVDDSVGHKPENKQVQSVPETQENYLCDSSLQYMFDDELALDFDKMSPFKQQIKEPTETAIENKQVKKLLAEGMGSESFASQGNYGRYVVTSVERDAYKGELLMQLTSLQDKSMKSCTLSGFWSQSVVSEGDVVHILFTHPVDGHFSIDNKKGLIVINPDFLISGTSVVSAVFCRRKAVLNERFKGLDSNNQLMLIGSLIHQLFQEVVKNKIQTHSKLDKLVQELMSQPTVLRDMYGLGVSEAHIYKEMNNFIPHIHAWSQQYLGSGMARSGKDQERGQRRNQWNGEIVKIQDIEENMWSPKFGVKGKIDLTVKTHQHGVSKVMPLELKTGKSSFSAEHRGQVTLYSMMSADRRQDPRAGLLLYLKDGAMEEVPAGDNEKRGLIQLRNDIIHYLRAKPVLEEGNSSPKLPPLPEPIDFERACTNCAHLLTCSVYQKSSEESLPEAPHAMATLVPKTTAHLTQIHLDYFRHWCLLLHLEIANGKRDAALRALWCQDATKRSIGRSSGSLLEEGDVEVVSGEARVGEALHMPVDTDMHQIRQKIVSKYPFP
ncbi:uncharacterized protein LOC121872220 [Homarus americanus]|uniref:uncharacterized protein LOC121872220 n=1 Tax=Homarus americanus TaxID=6706 RepID=UPI001C487F43|nr:uncharacterized protein LOC121872220 [Homarus americanus]